MRKLMSLLLAVVMVMSLATVAFAAEGYKDSDATTFNITKTYVSDVDWIPGETLSFVVTPDNANPDTTKTLTVGTNNTFKIEDTSETVFEIPVAVPSFSAVGEYKFTITETAGNTAGVDYNKDDVVIKVKILVAYDNVNDQLVINNTTGENGVIYWFEKEADGTKVSNFTNTYTTGGFTVDKNVEGNMANETDTFEVTVKLTNPETTVVLNGTPYTLGGQQYTWGDENVHTITVSEDGAAVTIDDLPLGVNVEIVEVETNENTKKGYADQGYTQAGYTVNKVTDEEAEKATGVVGTLETVVVENTKSTSVETGIITDSAPYIILIAVCALAAVLFVTKRRSVEF